ncbi:MAG TPA: amino acid ABC transporter permease [Clostridiaceae bacterium]|nr:amino acid ABC transporter permease [Clostridiaceae bacterium]
MKFAFIKNYYPFFLNGVKNTILLAFFAVLFGVFIGLFFSLMKLSKFKVFKVISSAYIEFIRGTPLMVQIFIIYYGLDRIGIKFPDIPALDPILGVDFADFMAGIITLSINSGAYVAEIIRAGIQAVDTGQMEAARSLGMSYFTAMVYIIIPQAFRNILPALGNEFIVVIKESSIVSVIGIADLMYSTQIIRGITYMPMEPLLVAAAIYFIITFSLSKLLGVFERRLRAGA